jgi:hypothetical protein
MRKEMMMRKIFAALAALLFAFAFAPPAIAQANVQSAVSPEVWAALQLCDFDKLFYFKTATCPVGDPPPLAVPTGSLEVRTAIASQWSDDLSVTNLSTTAFHKCDNDGSVRPNSQPCSAAPDLVGAYRQICGSAGVNYDDMLAFPGQPGKSHLHQYYGQQANAYSTYLSLRAGKTSTCAYGLYPGNLSSYWMPALLDGAGGVVQPDVVPIYYKRLPASSPLCGDPATGHKGFCIGIPTRFKEIVGYNMAGGWTKGQTHDGTRQMGFICNGVTGKLETLKEALDACPVGGTLIISIEFPACTDGRVDSPDHRGHVSYAILNKNTGQTACPLSHPNLMPTLSVKPQYRVTAALKAAGRLSCDPTGTVNCIHFDYVEAWAERLRQEWIDNCINKLLNCSGGNLGDGRQLIGAAQPYYTVNGALTPLWLNPNPVIPVPPMPTMPGM